MCLPEAPTGWPSSALHVHPEGSCPLSQHGPRMSEGRSQHVSTSLRSQLPKAPCSSQAGPRETRILGPWTRAATAVFTWPLHPHRPQAPLGTASEAPSGQCLPPCWPPCCVGCTAFPAHLKHFFVQNPGAKHNDAIDVYNGVVTAVQELSDLLFTVQDQGDIFLVDAECNSVPPAKKQTTRWVTSSSVASSGDSAANCWKSKEEACLLHRRRGLSRLEPGRCSQDTCGHRCQPHHGHREAHPTSGSLRFLVSQTRSAV